MSLVVIKPHHFGCAYDGRVIRGRGRRKQLVFEHDIAYQNKGAAAAVVIERKEICTFNQSHGKARRKVGCQQSMPVWLGGARELCSLLGIRDLGRYRAAGVGGHSIHRAIQELRHESRLAWR